MCTPAWSIAWFLRLPFSDGLFFTIPSRRSALRTFSYTPLRGQIFQFLLSLRELHRAPVRYLAVTKLSSYSVILVSGNSVCLPLQPLIYHGVVLRLRLLSSPLLGGMLNLPKVSVLVSLHPFSAYGRAS